MSKSFSRFGRTAAIMVLLAVASATVVFAGHSWGPYHWARTANPFTLKLGDNMSATWDAHLAVASSDWSVSSVLDTTVVAGQTNPRSCKPANGRVEVCNSRYGNNGWLGIAQIWISGSHITKGAVKLNDFYFDMPTYNTPAWRQFVVCQEVGHTLGLDHQDEIFGNLNLGTCMDYTSDPSTNQHPNAHDYEQLEAIYAHLDFVTTVGQSLPNGSKANGSKANGTPNEHAEWGKAVRQSQGGRNSLYEKDLGRGNKVFTFVVWAN